MHGYTDDRGRSLFSLFDHLPELPGQFNASVMYPGAVKAWHRHQRQDDHWVVLAGHLKIGLFNTSSTPLTAELRLATAHPQSDRPRPIDIPPRAGRPVYLSEWNPGVLRIPAGLWHGAVALGRQNALLLYYVTRRFDPDNPDEERMPWDAFDFEWGVQHR